MKINKPDGFHQIIQLVVNFGGVADNSLHILRLLLLS